ncbi:MAG: TrkH family potassium uptake protein [Bryobacteraceae bacterium]
MSAISIRTAPVARLLGLFLVLFGIAMLPAAGVGLAMGDAEFRLILAGALPVSAAGGLLFLLFRANRSELTVRESLLLVMLIWISASAAGSIPFVLSGRFPHFADAFFECASGFTTTGASVLPEVEVLPPAVQFWRHYTHWLGGMGIVLLMIAVLPVIGMGGVNLFRAHSAGMKSDKLKPRMFDTASTLWRVYIALTLAEYAMLRLAGMTPFDAICHTFSSLGTGGFSTHSTSAAYFRSPAIEYILALFMLLASINFARHYQVWALRDPRAYARDPEVRLHLGLTAAATCAIGYSLVASNGYGIHTAFRAALFQVVSIISCTGFASDDYEKWPYVAQFILFVLMWIGGNGGSTAGGVKTFRVLMLFRAIRHAFRRITQPRRIFSVRLGDAALDEPQVHSLLTMILITVMFYVAAVVAVTAGGVDLLTGLTAVISCMSGVGPAWGSAGPTENYAGISESAKWVLSACMLAGRVELYAFLVLFLPSFWRD